MAVAPKVSPQQQSEILMQALPHMLRYDDATVVVKYGGHAMGDEDERDFARDMVLLEQSGVNPVVVHGGGPQIGAMLTKLGIESRFSGGLRITDKRRWRSSRWCWPGSINKQLVGAINAQGGRAIGLCGKDGNMVTARKVTRPHEGGDGEPPVDLGFVGEPDRSNHGARAGARPRPDPGARAGRRRRRRRDLQRQRRHLRRRHRRRARRQAAAVPHRRAGRARQGRQISSRRSGSTRSAS